MKLYLKYVLLSLAFTIFFVFAKAQDKGLNFQGVARNSSNVLLASKQISIRLSIMDSTLISKTVVYSEVKTVSTNSLGLFSTVIGDGNEISKTGSFNNIDWSVNPKYLKIELDPANGTNFTYLGISQIQYAAFAHFAEGVMAENIKGILPLTKGGTGVGSLGELKDSLAVDKYLGNTSFGSFALINNGFEDFDTTRLSKFKIALDSKKDSVFDINNLQSSIFNTSYGYGNLAINTKGSANTSMGTLAMMYNSTGSRNTAIGSFSFPAIVNYNSKSNDNTAVGFLSLNGMSGSGNTSIGARTFNKELILSGDFNTAIGYGAGIDSLDINIDTIANSTAIGHNAYVNASNLIQLGDSNIQNVNTFGNIKAKSFKMINGLPTQLLSANGTVVNFSSDNTLGGSLASDLVVPSQKAVKSYLSLNTDGIAGVKSINGLRDTAQSIIISNSGIAPSVISNASIHTINIPLASTPSVTAGLIAKTDYDQFYNKSDFSGNYNDLFNKPIIPIAQIQSNWDQSDNSKLDYIQNKPVYEKIAYTGSYDDLSNKPTLISLGGIPLDRKITINGASFDLSQDRNWVVNPITASVSMETDVKDILAVTNGGTGSATKNFIDLTTNQIIDGAKKFTNTISVGSAPPEATAIVDINSTSKGFLPPRLTTAQRDAILNPAIGLTIFNTDTNCLEWWIGSIWYNACGNASVSTTTNGTANVTIIDCSSGTANGINGGAFDIGTPVNNGNSWQILNLKVNSIGNYSFTASANGITYSAVGQFYESDRLASISGTKAVYMYASGAAQNAGTFTYKLATLPFCVFTNNVNKTSSNGSSVIDGWASPSVAYGTLMKDVVVSGVNQKLRALVSNTPGTYKISSTQNGITFSADGNFPTANALYDVVLTASGIPVNAGTYTFTTNTIPSFTFTRTILSPTSNGTAVVNSWTGNPPTAGNIFVSNSIVNGSIIQTLTADVAVAGDYSVSAILNGITFSGTGAFTGTGSQTVVLTASGTPNAIGSNIFTINTMPSASFERLIQANPTTGGTAIVESWTNTKDNGSMIVGDPINFVSHTVTAFVSKIGTYNISASQNGILFSATGTFTSLGYQLVVLNATGTPITTGNNSFTLNVSNPCVFIRSVQYQLSTNGTAIINSFSGGTSSGNLYINMPVSGVTFTVNAEVTRVGTYLVDATIHGVTYIAQGTFTSTGNTPITYIASGTPNTIGGFKLLLITDLNTYTGPTIQINVNPTSNGTANITGWSKGTNSGIAFKGVAVDNVTQNLIANVTAAGTYSVSSTVNGVTFASSGTFTSTGSQTITLVASGTPINTWNTINTINTNPSFTYTYQYYSKSSNGTSDVSIWMITNTYKSIYYQGTVVDSSYYLDITANVTSLGTYSITASNNGIVFSGSGNFINLGNQYIRIYAAGAPINSGSYVLTSNTTPNFSISAETNSYTSNGTAVLSKNQITMGSATGELVYARYASNVTQQIIVNVEKIGTYNLSVSDFGYKDIGIKYSASGVFTSIGVKSITLVASGIPNRDGVCAFGFNKELADTPTRGFSMGFTNVVKQLPINVLDTLQGGIVFYLLKYGDPGYDPDLQHGLIMASVDQSSGIGWGGGAQYISPNSSSMFTGKSNTDAMFSFLGTATPNVSAVVKAYRGGGFNDWYLPSSDELEQMMPYSQLINLDLGFFNDYYWSSTEFGIGNAISIRAKTPGNINSPKSIYHRVRAIRSF